MRLAKTFKIDAKINEYIDASKGSRTASEGVNELLRRAMFAEQYDRLETEASAFFAHNESDRSEIRDFRKARASLLARLESQSAAKGAKAQRGWTRDELYEDK
jgi:hypothetical protein